MVVTVWLHPFRWFRGQCSTLGPGVGAVLLVEAALKGDIGRCLTESGGVGSEFLEKDLVCAGSFGETGGDQSCAISMTTEAWNICVH